MNLEDIQKIPDRVLLHEQLRRINCESMPKKNLILLGSPGAGKSTQAKEISKEFCYCHLSTEKMLNEASKELQNKILPYLRRGSKIPDDLMLNLIKNGMNSSECSRGFILSDYPKNASDAKKLDKVLAENDKNVNTVLHLNTEPEIAKQRALSNIKEYEMNSCYSFIEKKAYSVIPYYEPDGEKWYKTANLKDSLLYRFAKYQKKESKLLGYYKKKEILLSVDGNQNAHAVWINIRDSLIQLHNFVMKKISPSVHPLCQEFLKD